jgi:hypothetical protein
MVDLEKRAKENIEGRIADGVGVEDSFSLDMHLARVIAIGLEYFPDSQITDEIKEMQRVFLNYSNRGYPNSMIVDIDEIEKALDILKQEFMGLWW